MRLNEPDRQKLGRNSGHRQRVYFTYDDYMYQMLYFDDSRLIREEHFISHLWVLRIWGP